jgi:hypothetical protein
MIGGARGDQGRRFGRLLEPGEIQVVREGIARLLPLDNPEPGAHVQPARRRGDLVLVERDAVGDRTLVVDLGELAASAEAGLEKFLESVLVERLRGCRIRFADEVRFFPGEAPPDGIGDDERPRLHPFFQEASPVHLALRFENVHASSLFLEMSRLVIEGLRKHMPLMSLYNTPNRRTKFKLR